mgnify:CR=1 FL=1
MHRGSRQHEAEKREHNKFGFRFSYIGSNLLIKPERPRNRHAGLASATTFATKKEIAPATGYAQTDPYMVRKKVLLTGLMNPGEKYRNTRHNAGAMALDLIYPEADFRRADALESLLARVSTDDADLVLQKPETFMNLSGRAVQLAMRKFSISASHLIVLHDEVELLPGEVRYKFAGGHKGHNGLRSIIAQLGTADFHRIRIGVGRPADERGGIADFLLSHQPSTERAKPAPLQEALKLAFQAINSA